jgi:hypothetical protein
MSHVPGYSSARPFPDHRQLVRSPYGTPTNPLTPKPKRSPGLGLFGMIIVPSLGIGAIAVGGEYLTAPEPDIAVQSGIGFAAYDGADLALVPYDRNGSGDLISSMRHEMFEVRLAAVDLATGDSEWDVLLSEELSWKAAVVAAGEHYAYLATDDGLTILDLADGDVVTEPGDIPGFEGAQAVSGAAYAFDPGIGAVVALDVNGAVHTIALDALEAAPADADTTAAWSGLLFAEGSVPDIGGMTSTEALLADDEGSVRLEPTAAGALGSNLVLDGPEGQRALGNRVFYEAGIVLDQTVLVSSFTVEIDVDELIDEVLEDAAAAGQQLWTGLGTAAAGADSGHVLVEHRTEPGTESYAMHVIDAATGQVTASIATGSRLGRALTGPGGHTVVIAAPEGSYWLSDLVVVAPGGSLERVEIGRD